MKIRFKVLGLGFNVDCIYYDVLIIDRGLLCATGLWAFVSERTRSCHWLLLNQLLTNLHHLLVTGVSL